MEDRKLRVSLESIVKKAGEILLSYWGKPLTKRMKPKQGFVTEADLASESYLIRALSELFPQADFFAEESGLSGSNNSGYQWVIDPLDGTTNFAHGIPYYCVSVALTKSYKPLVSGIYVPSRDEFFFAELSKGAWLNDKKITVSAPELVSDAFVAVGLPYGAKRRSNALETVQEVSEAVGSIRHFGAVALDCAHVAAGRFDGLLFSGLGWWDVAAGMLLIQEAGGTISDFSGEAIDPDYPDCVAGGPRIYQELQSILKKL